MRYSHRWTIKCGTCGGYRPEFVSGRLARFLARWHCFWTRHPYGDMTIGIGRIQRKGWEARP